jgi:hypothetical protein
MGTQRIQMKKFLPWLVRWAYTCRAGISGCSSQLTTKYIFPHRTLFLSLVPIAQQAGQAAVLGRLSLTVVCVSAYDVEPREHKPHVLLTTVI